MSYIYMKLIFQQNVCYIKNSIVLTQVTGCSLSSMIVKNE